MTKEKDKHDYAIEVFEKLDYSMDDLAELLCRMFKNQCDLVAMKELGLTESEIERKFYSEGKKFTLKIKMEDEK